MDEIACRSPPDPSGRIASPADRDYGFWSELPCMGCGRPLATTDPTQRQCQQCRAEMLEALAHRIDPSYDPAHNHEWEECERVLRRLYGKG